MEYDLPVKGQTDAAQLLSISPADKLFCLRSRGHQAMLRSVRLSVYLFVPCPLLNMAHFRTSVTRQHQ